METGSAGGGSAGDGAGGDDHLHGLKFGKKIYFEDAGGSGSGSGSGSSGGSGSAGAPPPPPPSASPRAAGGGGRRGRAAAGGASGSSAPARCQVEGCNLDLTGAKPYHCRHKVCAMHAKSPLVVVNGIEQRFCQQCSRFHQLHEFDQGKRSCRRRLAGHNERRRRPPTGPLAPRYGRLASFREEQGRFRSFLLDFSYPVPSSMRDGWPAVQPGERVPGSIQWQASLDPHHHSAVAGYGAHSYGSQGSSSSGPPVFPGPELPPGGCLAGVPVDSSCALSLLSTQPWDTTHSTSHSRASSMPATADFDGNPVAPSLMASSYIAPTPWPGSRGHEGGRNVAPQLPPDVPLNEVHSGSSSHHGQFSGELELALQGNRPAPVPRIDQGSTSTFDQAGSTTDWSL